MSELRCYLLLKRGLYYRPDNQGYTGIKEYAGRYLESDASPDSGVAAIHERDAPDYSAACFADLMTKHILEKLANANTAIEARDREIAALREALQQCAEAPFSGWTIAQGIARNALKGASS